MITFKYNNEKILIKKITNKTHDKLIFSGIQPTSIPHLGNYFGAIKKWVNLQNQESNQTVPLIISVVDLHAITIPKETKILK